MTAAELQAAPLHKLQVPLVARPRNQRLGRTRCPEATMYACLACLAIMSRVLSNRLVAAETLESAPLS